MGHAEGTGAAMREAIRGASGPRSVIPGPSRRSVGFAAVQIWRVVGAIGRAMMRAGVLVLLFVVYQLWGTGLITERQQDHLSSQFDQLLAEAATTTSTTSTTALAPGPPVTAPADLPLPEQGDPIGRIEIPDIGVDFVYVQGVELKDLRDGPGHFPQTPMPGQAGNAALAGHRTTYAAPFNRLDELGPGAEITIETLQGTFTYRVDAQPAPEGEEPRGWFTVSPSQVEILEQDGTNRLTLVACHPKYSASQRIVVTATLDSPVAPSTPLPDTEGENATVTFDATDDPLAGGDSSAWVPAILWTGLALGVWFATWFASRQLRRRKGSWSWGLLPYVVGVPVFAVVLFIAFTDIARLLPAAY
jgi:sortase A